MKLLPRTFENRLRLAAGLVLVGLVVALPTLFWTHPLSFMLFVPVASGLTALGILVYLISLLRHLTVKDVPSGNLDSTAE